MPPIERIGGDQPSYDIDTYDPPPPETPVSEKQDHFITNEDGVDDPPLEGPPHHEAPILEDDPVPPENNENERPLDPPVHHEAPILDDEPVQETDDVPPDDSGGDDEPLEGPKPRPSAPILE
jgi:hypothetical protein